MASRSITAGALALTLLGFGMPAQAYIGEGVQGRPHGGARVAVRNQLYRHGFGSHRHPRGWYRRHYGF